MQEPSQINYFGQRILQIIQPLVAGTGSGTSTDRRQILTNLAQSVADNFAADGCWLLQYPSPNVARVLASACTSYRTQGIEDRLSEYSPPTALQPTMWQMPLLPDYNVIVVNTCYQQQVQGCLMLATKGVEWYPETKLVLQIAADYIATALVQEELQQQAQIAQIYPALHYHLTQAIVENQDVDRLFEIAVSDMVTALGLKRGFVLNLKSNDLQKQSPQIVKKSQNGYSDPIDSTGELTTPISSIVVRKPTPIQILPIIIFTRKFLLLSTSPTYCTQTKNLGRASKTRHLDRSTNLSRRSIVQHCNDSINGICCTRSIYLYYSLGLVGTPAR
jgi:hypothetical protein